MIKSDTGQQILEATEMNWLEIKTPIKVDALENLLIETGYDKVKRKRLVQGFREGFDIGYRGPMNRCDTAKNLPFKVGSRVDLWNKVMKEVQEGRYAGPFESPPGNHYIQSPLGLVPKSGNKLRLIFHLSYDFGTSWEQRSVNFHTPEKLCSVKYNDLDHAVKNCLKILNNLSNTQPIYFAKSDCSNAFRIVPVLPLQRLLLCMQATHPETGKTYFFVEKCLPFGASISCAIFQSFSDALRYITEHKLSGLVIFPAITNYLDDFLFVAISVRICNGMVEEFLVICKVIGCPISMEKTEWATQVITFLGVLLNGITRTLAVPIEKKNKALELINIAIQKRKVTIKFVQRITGTLNFLNRVIVPGRAFTRGMYSKLRTVNKKTGEKLQLHHHVHLNREFIQDCQMWKYFLNLANGTQLCRPFTDFSKEGPQSVVLDFTADASKNPDLGMGAVFKDRWMFAQWPKDFVKDFDPSIEFLELFALTAALEKWGSDRQLRNGRVTIFCDNEAVVHMVNNSASSCEFCMRLIRIIVFRNIIYNRRIDVLHLRSEENFLSDALSRLNLTKFWRLAPKTTRQYPDHVPESLWPVSKFFKPNYHMFQA